MRLRVLLSTAFVGAAHAEAIEDRWNLNDLDATPAAWDAVAGDASSLFANSVANEKPGEVLTTHPVRP